MPSSLPVGTIRPHDLYPTVGKGEARERIGERSERSTFDNAAPFCLVRNHATASTMDVESELKLREKTAKADAQKDAKDLADSKSGIATAAVAEDVDIGGGGGSAGGIPPTTRPGAVAVRGPEYQGSGFDDASMTVPGPGGGRGDDDEEAPPLQVDSYVVQDPLPTDEEIRQRILAGTAHAEEVDKVVPSGAPRGLSRRAAAWLIVVVVVVATAIAVGIAVPLSSQTTSHSSSPQHDESVVASFKYLERQGNGGFAQSIFAQTRVSAGSLVTSGASELLSCRPKACLASDTSCVVGDSTYVPGCCAGADCPSETKCGEQCPSPPDSCRLINSTDTTCTRSECYTCEDDYVLNDYAVSIDCLEVGTAIRPENGLEYKWAIYCGPVTVGPVVEENRDVGEYQCSAVRLGANFSDETGGGGLLGLSSPCQYLALAECGCGPSDMYTFGRPAPNGTCQPDSGCPILCEGVGGSNEYARNLCRSFPGNISWWEGANAFNVSRFTENSLAPEYEFEIYIKGVD